MSVSRTLLRDLGLFSPSQLPDKFGITPLLAAIYEGHGGVVKILLAHVSSSFFSNPSVIPQ